MIRFQIVPPARGDDGCFHVCLAKGVGKLETLRILPIVYRGSHTGQPSVDIFTARRITVKPPVPLTVQADGEIIGTLQLTLEIFPGSLKVLAPFRPEKSEGTIYDLFLIPLHGFFGWSR